MSEVSPEIIAKTQKSLGKYVKKPALTEKLLKKPPFRFLHDLVKAVIKETGFLNGLFTEGELNSENVKEKEAKVAFLTKLIEAVKTVSKTDLKVRPSKIVAGLEPAETNSLLQTIAKSIDRKIDTKDYVAKLNSGDIIVPRKEKTNKTTDKPKEKKHASKDSIRNNKDIIKTIDSSVNRTKKTSSIIETETPKSTDRARESTRSNNTARDEKKDKISSSKVIKDKKEDRSSRKEISKSRRDGGDKVDQKKQSSSKVNRVDSKEEPINNTVEISNNKEPIDNRENIVTATELIEERNNDSIANVVSNDDIDGINENVSASNATATESVENREDIDRKLNEKLVAGFSNARQGSAGLVRPKSARPKSGDRVHSSSRGSRGDLQENGDRRRLNIGDREGGSVVGPVEMKATTPAALPRPPSSLRPPSVRPSSARPGAPRLRPESALPTANEPVLMGNINVIVENFDAGQQGDDEDTVVIQNAPELTEDDGIQETELLNISGKNKGQLVEQILEQIQEGQEDGVRKKVEIDWEQDGLRGKDATTKEVTRLRTLIQSLTRTANPLGKLMNYLHEDLDAMHNELQTWTDTKKRLYADIDKQKRLTLESGKPLLDKLDHLKNEIKKQEQEILILRSNILRNDQRISELLGTK